MESYAVFDIGVEPGLNFYCESFVDNSAGISISLVNKATGVSINVCFEYAYSYCKTNESYRLGLQERLPQGSYLVLNVQNSQYLEWFHMDSKNIYLDLDIQHYLLITDDDIIDVLSGKPPVVVR